MPILDSALAFALTMLVVATVVTYTVRLLQDAAKLRRDEMKKMLTKYFAKELQPVVEREMHRLKKTVTAKFADEVNQKAKLLDETVAFTTGELATLIDVSTDELTERLKRSEMGQKLLSELGDKAQAVFDELGKRYEAVGDEFTKSFRKSSRWWATGVAFVLALLLNVDSLYIADSYIKNEGLRQSVIAQRDSFVQDYNNLAASLQSGGKDSVTKDELAQAFSDSRTQLDVFTSSGFPIGWSYFPHAYIQNKESKDFQQRNNFGGWIMWAAGILMTAGLAGLGAPFWFDAVTGLSRAAQSASNAKKPAS